MNHEYSEYSITYYVLIVIFIILNILVTIVIYLTCSGAWKVKEKMDKKHLESEGEIGNSKFDEKELNEKEDNFDCMIRKTSSCPTFPSTEPHSSPPRKYSRRLSKTESEETADNLLEIMFSPNDTNHHCRTLQRSLSDNAVNRRRKFGYSKGSCGVSFNSLNIINETDIQ